MGRRGGLYRWDSHVPVRGECIPQCLGSLREVKVMALECKVLISKESGVKIEVINADKKTTQTFHMDGLKIEMEIENTESKKTSKMVQNDGSFEWTVKVKKIPP